MRITSGNLRLTARLGFALLLLLGSIGCGAVRHEPLTPESAAPQGWLWPLDGGQILARFGEPRTTHAHQGIDIRGPHGAPVHAAAGGRVTHAGNMRGYGKTLIVDHGAGLSSLYAHASTLLVGLGDRVERGQPIARVGRSGNATTAHCHFEIRHAGIAVDPLPYLRNDRGSLR